MRNRSNYNYTPAQGSLLQQRPEPRRNGGGGTSKGFDRVLLILFFIVLPAIALISLFWSAMQWLFILVCLGTIALLWMRRGFTQRGRVVMTGLYAVLLMVMLTSALGSGGSGQLPRTTSTATVPPINYQNYVTDGQTNPMVASGGAVPAANPNGGVVVDTSQTGGIDPSQQGQGGITDPNAATGGSGTIVDPISGVAMQPRVASTAAEKVLEQFLEAWRSDIMANMVPLTAPSWRATLSASQNGPEQKLYWQFSNKKLDSWQLVGEPTGTDTDTSRTVTLIANIMAGDEQRKYKYDALMLQADGQWFVDPYSLQTGTRVDLATPAPADGVAVVADGTVATPPPTPAPTKTPGPKTKLYYNASGGKYYHIEANCKAVDEKYLPLKSFTYSKLNDSPYSKLSPCKTCNAPSRP